MDVIKFKGLIKDLYRTVDQLESMFPGRHFTPDGNFAVIYNGPGTYIWAHFENKNRSSKGQFQIVLNKLLKLNKQISSEIKIEKVIYL